MQYEEGRTSNLLKDFYSDANELAKECANGFVGVYNCIRKYSRNLKYSLPIALTLIAGCNKEDSVTPQREPLPSPAPSKPAITQIVPDGWGEAYLGWTDSDSETEYDIFRSKES